MSKILDNLWFGLCVISFFWVLLFMIFAPLILGLIFHSYWIVCTYFVYAILLTELIPEKKVK